MRKFLFSLLASITILVSFAENCEIVYEMENVFIKNELSVSELHLAFFLMKVKTLKSLQNLII